MADTQKDLIPLNIKIFTYKNKINIYIKSKSLELCYLGTLEIKVKHTFMGSINIEVPTKVNNIILKIYKNKNVSSTKEKLYLTSFFKKYLLPVYDRNTSTFC